MTALTNNYFCVSEALLLLSPVNHSWFIQNQWTGARQVFVGVVGRAGGEQVPGNNRQFIEGSFHRCRGRSSQHCSKT